MPAVSHLCINQKKYIKIKIKNSNQKRNPQQSSFLQTTRKMNRTASVSRTAFTVAARQTTGTHTERVVLFAHAVPARHGVDQPDECN